MLLQLDRVKRKQACYLDDRVTHSNRDNSQIDLTTTRSVRFTTICCVMITLEFICVAS